MRPVTMLKMRRKPIQFMFNNSWLPWRWGGFDYGHWWFEIGAPSDPAAESFGWWPIPLPGNVMEKTIATLFGTTGDLNSQGDGGGTPTEDPYGRSPATVEVAFHPVIAANDPRTDADIADCLRRFARVYTGEWRWTFGRGQNCHSFQRAAMRHCGLYEPRWLIVQKLWVSLLVHWFWLCFILLGLLGIWYYCL